MRGRDAVVWEGQRTRLAARLDRDNLPADPSRPMILGTNVRYEIAARIWWRSRRGPSTLARIDPPALVRIDPLT
jgi:hypothetical protein